ncbi:MAG: hypothetical protein AAF569_07915 [Pseudomonadota bacterium]
MSLSLPLPAEAQRESDFRDSIDFLIDDGIMTPDEMAEEAMGIHNRCVADVMKNTYYDCECIGGAFLSIREEVGPYYEQYDILTQIYTEDPQCIDEVNIAGMAYTDCQNMSEITRRNETNNDEYCECVAQGTVKQFGLFPSLRTRTIEGVRAQAISDCLAEYPPQSLLSGPQ